MTRAVRAAAVLAAAALVCLPAAAAAGPVEVTASGAAPADIQAAVGSFRATLGTLNPNTAGTVSTGRREIAWDDAPTATLLARDFYNNASPRGVLLSSPSDQFQV